MQSSNPKHAALLIVDMQVGLLDGPERPYERDRVLANINRLIAKARQTGVPVFAVRHTGPQGSPIEEDSLLWQLHPDLHIDAGKDEVFNKTLPNSFWGTDLAERLSAIGVRELAIAGMKTQFCIDSTCRAAAERGFRPILVADAHTCMDTPEWSARAIIAHHNATLVSAFARVLATEDWQP